MLINNPEALKNWLVIILEPLCDADSSALARYVLALLKKDKPDRDLKKVMIEQLDVFLAEETKSFVDRLFNAITSEEYLEPTPQSTTQENLYVMVPGVNLKLERELTPPLDDVNKTKDLYNIMEDSKPNLSANDTHSSSELSLIAPTSPVAPSTPPPPILGSLNSVSPFKATSDKENYPRSSRRRRSSLLRSRSRSRSRSNDRLTRRSRSRDRRQCEREKNARQFRNKSPPLHIERRHRRERRRGSHVIDERTTARANFGVKNRVSPTASGSRSSSEERRKVASPNSNSSPRSPVYNKETGKKQRCRDFDEKGYCVRGETCPWDHGVNPVVFEGINNSALIGMSLREYNPDAPDLWSRSSTTAAGQSVSNSPSGNSSGGIIFAPRSSFNHKSGNSVSGLYPRGGSFCPTAPIFPFPLNAVTPLQRELIPVPVVDANGSGGDISAIQSKRRYDLEDSVAIAEGPAKRKSLSSRLGARIPNLQGNCSLELRKIPRGMNTIAHLNNHFAKFGKIVNIQISYDGDPEAAIVTFSNHAEANVAYRSTEAVLNNRFIKVFWHSQHESLQMGGGNQTLLKMDDVTLTTIINGNTRKSSQYHISNISNVPTPSSDTAKTQTAGLNTSIAASTSGTFTNTMPISTQSVTHTPSSSLRLKNTPQLTTRLLPAATTAIIRKNQEEKAKAVVQLANGLRKRKQELLQGYLRQLKSAIELIERCDPTDPHRIKTVDTIKVLQKTIDKLRDEISAEQEQITTQIHNNQIIQHQPNLTSLTHLKKTKEQQKKELLDIELELFAQQQEGNDTTAIQKRLEDLQRSLAIGTSSKPHFQSSGPRPNKHTRPIVLPTGSTSVDRRPKSLIITSFPKEDCQAVLAHFKTLGEVVKYDIQKSIPQIIVSYITRSVAEQAFIRGTFFKDKRIQVKWAPVVNVPPAPVKQATETSAADTSKPAEPADTNRNSNAAKFVVVNNNNDVSDANKTYNSDSADSVSKYGSPTYSMHSLPELRLEDEDDEEESEVRSWRR